MDNMVYKSPSIKVVETTVYNVMCSSPDSYKVSNEGLEQEDFEW